MVLVFFISLFLYVSPVSAVNACCQKDTSGNFCQYTDEANCDAGYLSAFTSCEQTSYCQTGCCYSSDDGSCYKNTNKASCLAESGTTWSDSANCAIDQCQQGCCVIGDQASFVTEVKCKSVGSQYSNASVSFDSSITTEPTCLDSVKNKDFGCCVSGSSAVFQTREECSTASTAVSTNFSIEGFHKDMLCSNDLLSSECAKQQYTACYNGKVYWYDSCGNRENIYNSDARTSYNEGYVLKEQDSCIAAGANDPNCGNCDYAQGELCGKDTGNIVSDGDYICQTVNCASTFQQDASPLSGQARKNGESWCVYDSKTGQGLDTVGSRQYRHLCINGQELTEPCTDYREQICVGGVLTQDALDTLSALHLSSGDYVEAACRENRASSCNSCNDDTLGLTERYKCCAQEDTQDCYWLPTGAGIQSGETYEDGRCVPQVPPGQKFWGEDGSSNDISSATCNAASSTCAVTYRIGGFSKIFSGGSDPNSWKIISESPDGCATRDWLVDQNTYCRSLGDCGAYYNFIGEPGYDGFTSNMFDENFFNGVKDIKALEVSDLGDWNSLKSVEVVDESLQFFSFDSPHFYENPAFTIAVVSALIGGISNIANTKDDSCMAAVAAKNAADVVGIVQLGAACNPAGITPDKKCVKGLTCKSGVKGATCVGGAVPEVAVWGVTAGGACAADATTADKKCAEGLSCISGKCGKEENSGSTPPAEQSACEKLGYVSGYTGDPYSYKCVATGGYVTCINGKGSSKVWTTADPGAAVVYACSGVTELSQAHAPAPLVPQLASSEGSNALGTATSAASTVGQVKDLTQATDALGCFFGGALPIPTKLLGGKAKSGITAAANWVTVAAVAYLAVEYGFQNETTVTYTAGCQAWQAPTGGDTCEQCNNPNMPCSEYRCRSLGTSCGLVNPGTSEEACVSLYVNDVNSPVITPDSAAFREEGYSVKETTEEGDKGFVINEKIPAFTPITFTLNTDEPGQCKYSPEVSTAFEDMNSYFGDNLYTYNHSLTVSLSSQMADQALVDLNGGIYTLYVRCADSNGNANERDYFMRYSIDTTPDLTPPEVTYTSINDGSYMPYNATETAFSLYTNEPASCKWANNDTAYEFMGNSMSCADSGFQQSSAYYGSYACSTTLMDVAKNDINSFYFRCQDQSGNVNEESFKFTTKKTQTPLEILSLSPSGNVYDAQVHLKATTKGGAENGAAVCGFSPENAAYSSMAMFFSTNGSTHSQDLSIPVGDYTYYVTCQDVAGNTASNKTSFTVAVDTFGPGIKSLFVDTAYSVLSLETDEDASCEYASTSFTYGDGTLMTGINTTTHEASLDALKYSIICNDLFNNQASYLVDITALI